jgi:hypothetical protein
MHQVTCPAQRGNDEGVGENQTRNTQPELFLLVAQRGHIVLFLALFCKESLGILESGVLASGGVTLPFSSRSSGGYGR